MMRRLFFHALTLFLLGILAPIQHVLASGSAEHQPRPDWPSSIVFTSVVGSTLQFEASRARFAPFLNYMEREVGVKFTMRHFESYDDVIESQRRGETHLAAYGPAAYATARSRGVQITPFSMAVRGADDTGYFSVFLVRADSPITTIADLKGKHLGLVDARSTSGNIVPRMELFKLGIVPEQYFGKITYLGSHELAILGVAAGEVDVAVNAWGETTGMFYESAIRNGAVKRGDLRVLLRSLRIPNGPMAYLDSLPEELKARIRRASFAMPEKAPEALKLAFGSAISHVLPVDHSAYIPQMELNAFVEGLSKR